MIGSEGREEKPPGRWGPGAGALLSSSPMEEPHAAGSGTSEIPPQKPAHVREFTPRAVIAALLVAAVIGASYPYIVLKLGFGPNISVVSAFFGFLALGLVSKTYNRWENNLVQTAGTAAGQIAFLCWLLAAFDMLRADPGSGFTLVLDEACRSSCGSRPRACSACCSPCRCASTTSRTRSCPSPTASRRARR